MSEGLFCIHPTFQALILVQCYTVKHNIYIYYIHIHFSSDTTVEVPDFHVKMWVIQQLPVALLYYLSAFYEQIPMEGTQGDQK